MQWKMPPIEKIYEAWSAIADGRASILDDSATVKSSDFSKEYTVEWKNGVYYSNDNASYWQGYYGYPVIAVLMLQDLLPFDKEIANLFRGIEWKKLNAKYKRDYAAAAAEVLSSLCKNADPEKIKARAALVYDVLSKLQLERSRIRLK